MNTSLKKKRAEGLVTLIVVLSSASSTSELK